MTSTGSSYCRVTGPDHFFSGSLCIENPPTSGNALYLGTQQLPWLTEIIWFHGKKHKFPKSWSSRREILQPPFCIDYIVQSYRKNLIYQCSLMSGMTAHCLIFQFSSLGQVYTVYILCLPIQHLGLWLNSAKGLFINSMYYELCQALSWIQRWQEVCATTE